MAISSAVPSLDKFPSVEDDKVPGELRFGFGDIMLSLGRKAVRLRVTNTGDRPIQVVILCVVIIFFCMHLLLS